MVPLVNSFELSYLTCVPQIKYKCVLQTKVAPDIDVYKVSVRVVKNMSKSFKNERDLKCWLEVWAKERESGYKNVDSEFWLFFWKIFTFEKTNNIKGSKTAAACKNISKTSLSNFLRFYSRHVVFLWLFISYLLVEQLQYFFLFQIEC